MSINSSMSNDNFSYMLSSFPSYLKINTLSSPSVEIEGTSVPARANSSRLHEYWWSRTNLHFFRAMTCKNPVTNLTSEGVRHNCSLSLPVSCCPQQGRKQGCSKPSSASFCLNAFSHPKGLFVWNTQRITTDLQAWRPPPQPP
jgi:hypothetical protein